MRRIEIWLPVLNFENAYVISSFGQVYSLIREKFVTPARNSSGYLQTRLWKNNCRVAYYVHRLVYIHFVSAWDESLDINHIDGNKYNNCVWNLEAVTKKENHQHAVRTGLITRTNTGKFLRQY